MTTITRLRATRLLALAAVVLTLLSYGTYKAGLVRELYPFFYWRLFSEPVGWDGSSTYRLYVRSAANETWERQPIRPLPGYTKLKQYTYQWNTLVREALEDSLNQTAAHERLLVFVDVAAPDASEYRIVAETFHPLDLLEDPTAYDTTTVLHLTR
jgi:hypothetical protein